MWRLLGTPTRGPLAGAISGIVGGASIVVFASPQASPTAPPGAAAAREGPLSRVRACSGSPCARGGSTVRCEGGGSTTLAGKIDPYGGIIVDALALPHDLPSFEARLDASLAAWRGSNVRGVWLKIPIRKSVFISAAVDRGFAFHHAEPAYCMLTHWLPTGEANPLPRGPSTQVGVGALVVNQEGKVLLVQEAVGASAGKNIWKIPTGVLEPREELLEEVGLKAQFVKVLGFRHTHALPFGKSDMFFVCLLRATCKDTSELTLQRSEIAKAKWADIREFLEQAPYPRDMPVWAELYAACVGTDGVVGNVRGIRAEKVPATPDPKGRQEYYYF